jgi:heme/copper-type cytochrome/quinol oxidase subunit 2
MQDYFFDMMQTMKYIILSVSVAVLFIVPLVALGQVNVSIQLQNPLGGNNTSLIDLISRISMVILSISTPLSVLVIATAGIRGYKGLLEGDPETLKKTGKILWSLAVIHVVLILGWGLPQIADNFFK